MLNFIAGYVARGWRVITIHRITGDGMCSCWRGESCPEGSRGKHPVADDWTNAAVAPDTVAQVFGPDGRTWNVGILTGAPSGFWVLDVDPGADGPARLAELEREHGALPPTHQVRTGSGGWHYYWRMPEDGSPMTNAKGRLPRGLDVRGTGGQVVAPPSVSGKGGYQEMTVGTPVADAPAWLYELIRPRPVETAPLSVTLPGVAHQAELDGLSPSELARVASYAQAAVAAELRRVSAALEGERNITAFNAACNLHELTNARWSQLDPQAVVSAWYDAARSTGLGAAEISQVWASASRKVGAAHRAYPTLGEGTPVAGVLPPFQQPPGTWGGPFVGPYSAPNGAPGPGQAPGAIAMPGPVEPALTLRAQLQTLDAALAQPDQEWLVDGWLVSDASSWLIGASGIGKSFAAVSLAGSVCTAVPWFGNSVKPGRVLYLAAEGSRGMAKRFAAWRQEYWSAAEPLPGLSILPVPVQASAAQWWELCELAAADRYALIVLDTQARITVGMEENSNTDMGQFVDRVEALRRASGAAVLVVHHQGKNGAEARGASALKAAAQTEVTARRDLAGQITLAVTKQKDAAEPSPVLGFLRPPRPVPGALVGQVGTSVVLAPWEAGRGQMTEELEEAAGVNSLAQIAASVFYEGVGGTKAEFRRSARERGMGSSDTFTRSFNRLLTLGVIAPIIGRTGSYRWIPLDERLSGTDMVEVVVGNGQVISVPGVAA